jgi:hypothetical protein
MPIAAEYFHLHFYTCHTHMIRPVFASIQLLSCEHSDDNRVLKQEIDKSVCGRMKVDGNIKYIMTLPSALCSGRALRVSHAPVNPLQSLLQCI